MTMSETRHFLKNWGIISLAAIVPNNILWWLTTSATLLTIIYLCLYYSRIVVEQADRNVGMH